MSKEAPESLPNAIEHDFWVILRRFSMNFGQVLYVAGVFLLPLVAFKNSIKGSRCECVLLATTKALAPVLSQPRDVSKSRRDIPPGHKKVHELIQTYWALASTLQCYIYPHAERGVAWLCLLHR